MNIRDAHPGRVTALAGRALLAILVVLGVSMLGAAAASATGDPTVEPYIISNPVPGWTTAPSSVTQQVQSQVSSSLSSKTHEKIAVAVDGWSGPDVNTQILLIMLVKFPGSSVPSSANIPAAVNDVCTGAGDTPGTITPISGISGSASETCQGSSPISAVAWAQGNVVAFIDAEGLAMSNVDQISQTEAAKIPANGIGVSSSSSSSALYGGIGVVVVAAVIVVVVLARRRSKAQLAPAPGAGWPAPGAAPQWGQPAAPQAPYGAIQPYAGEPAAYGAGAAGYQTPGAGYQPPAAAYPAEPAAYEAPAAAYQAAPAPTPAGSTGPAQTPYEAVSPPDGETQTVAGPQAYHGATPAFEAEPAAERPTSEGWYPIEGDTNRQRYWDGTEWTSSMRWDGHAWVNES